MTTPANGPSSPAPAQRPTSAATTQRPSSAAAAQRPTSVTAQRSSPGRPVVTAQRPASTSSAPAQRPASAPAPTASTPTPASTTARGRQAEALAAAYLERQGFGVLSRNWRNRWCELDIVAAQQVDAAPGPAHATDTAQGVGAPRIIHFVEVKYRRTIAFGYAAEYVSRDKQARLIRAAAAWCQANHYDGPYQISVLSVEGDLASPAITFLPGAVFA